MSRLPSRVTSVQWRNGNRVWVQSRDCHVSAVWASPGNCPGGSLATASRTGARADPGTAIPSAVGARASSRGHSATATAVPAGRPLSHSSGPGCRLAEGKAACPRGTLLRGAAPPKGKEIGCVSRDGEQQFGRQTTWSPDRGRCCIRTDVTYAGGVWTGQRFRYNEDGTMSRRRGRAVVEHLQRRGISPVQLLSDAIGSRLPIVEPASDPRNNRVDLIVLT